MPETTITYTVRLYGPGNVLLGEYRWMAENEYLAEQAVRNAHADLPINHATVTRETAWTGKGGPPAPFEQG